MSSAVPVGVAAVTLCAPSAATPVAALPPPPPPPKCSPQLKAALTAAMRRNAAWLCGAGVTRNIFSKSPMWGELLLQLSVKLSAWLDFDESFVARVREDLAAWRFEAVAEAIQLQATQIGGSNDYRALMCVCCLCAPSL